MPEYRIKTVLTIDPEDGMADVGFLLSEKRADENWYPVQLFATVDELAFELTYENLSRS